jgi:subtilase family serine protease
VAADANPASGAAVYDSTAYQGRKGWFRVGGTSLSSPLIAAVFALAGNAATINYAASLPYGHIASLHDVTGGSNGSCGTTMCRGAVGYDGPTGVGTPKGTGGF